LEEIAMKKKVWINLLISLTLLAGCVSSNKTREEYFGFNNEPKYEKQEKNNRATTPSIYSYPEKKDNYNRLDDSKQQVYIINNYYPYPYDPRFIGFYDSYDYYFSLRYFDLSYDPFIDYYIIYVPYNRKHHFVYIPYPYWRDYWWDRRPPYVFVPYDYEKPREKKVRDFGPSRGSYDYNDRVTPTKEPRSSSRNGEEKKSTIRPDTPQKESAEPVKLKLPSKSSEPGETPSNKEVPKSESNTKQNRSSTRPR
jgi:hypothetical protein